LATPEARSQGAAGGKQAAPAAPESPAKPEKDKEKRGFPFGKPRAAAPAKAPAKPAPPPDATTVDTISAVRRRIDAAATPPGGRPETRQWRLGWIGAGVVLLAMFGLLIGRALRSHPKQATDATDVAEAVAPPASARARPAAL